MKIPQLRLRGLEAKLGLPVPHLFKEPKRFWFLTYTLTPDAVDELNFLHQRGSDIQGMAGKLLSDVPFPKFKFRLDPACHAKVWIIDNSAYIGSANLAGDTIFNIMLSVDDKERKKLENIVKDIINKGIMIRPTTVIV